MTLREGVKSVLNLPDEFLDNLRKEKNPVVKYKNFEFPPAKGGWLILAAVTGLWIPSPFQEIWLAVGGGGSLILTGVLLRKQVIRDAWRLNPKPQWPFPSQSTAGDHDCPYCDGGQCFFTLKKHLGLTDGNLSAHLRVLEEAGYVQVEKSSSNESPKPSAGREAFLNYLKQLEEIIQLGAENGKKREPLLYWIMKCGCQANTSFLVKLIAG